MFSVGEIAILCGGKAWSEYNGMECTILGGLEDRYGCNKTGFGYWSETYFVRCADGKEFNVKPYNLRKKPPYDGNVKTSWDDLIVWKPKEVVYV